MLTDILRVKSVVMVTYQKERQAIESAYYVYSNIGREQVSIGEYTRRIMIKKIK